MNRKHILWSTLVVLLLILGSAPAWVSAAPPRQGVGENLLRNPGFEEGSTATTCAWTRDTYTGVPYGEIFTPPGWVTFWSEGANATGGTHGRPECKVIPNVNPFIGPPARIRTGSCAVMQFGFFRTLDSGVYQTVGGLSPGATVQFSAYAHAWSCDMDSPGAVSCGDTYNMLFQVGIDPNGGTNPWSGSVVWASGYSYDTYRLIGPVQAVVGETGQVTVFLRATAKWPFKHNDAYWDDAALVYTTPPTPPTGTPLPPPPTRDPNTIIVPVNTPTPRPDGAIVHVVQPGDTLFGIAFQYNVPLEQIQRLNATSIGPNNMIWTGQELVISMPNVPPTATPPAPTAQPTEVAQVTETAQLPSSGGSLCIVAYHDRNGDTFWQADTEEKLPNATLSVGSATQVIGQYITDGLSEPYCFQGLQAGSYRVMMQPPPGYAPSGPADTFVALGDGTTLNLALGAQRSAETTGTENEPPATHEPATTAVESGSNSAPPALRTIAGIGGVLLILIAIAGAVVFVVSRGRM
jgi:LysM repeat protein